MSNNLKNMLKELRTTNNLKQKDIASKIGVMERTYCNYENGTREPDLDTLIDIADFYNVSLDILTGRYKKA